MDQDASYFPDIVSKQRVATDLKCRECGYNLRGLDIYKSCPECSVDVLRSVETAAQNAKSKRPIDRRWRLPCVALVIVGAFTLLGFHLILWINDLEMGDLRPTAIRVPGRSATNTISSIGHFLSSALFLISMLGGLYCFCVAVVAALRRDKKALAIAGSSAILAIVFAVLALRIGFTIAGI